MNFEPNHEGLINFLICMTALIGLGMIILWTI